MARTKVELPGSFQFSTAIPVRITDLNYGGHVGNDTVLSIIHEARIQCLYHYGYSEMNFGGAGMIMTDVAIEFKNELFYGDTVRVAVTIAEMSKFTFAFFYKLEKAGGDKSLLVAAARTGMVCFDYAAKKMMAVPELVKQQFV